MTDNEIIKALERCSQHNECCYCNSLEECGSKRVLTSSTLDLINRQKAEIDILIRKKDSLRDEIAEQQAEIESLREAMRELKREMSYMVNPNTIGDRYEMGCW